MKKIKEFLDKTTKDVKFKSAGTGHKLSDSAGPSASTSKSSNEPASAPVRRTGPDPNVASAVLARLDTKVSNKPTTKSTLHDIMAEEKKKIAEEMKLKEELQERKQKQAQVKEELERNPFKEFEESQRFTCSALGFTDSQPFNDLISKVKVKIFDDYSNDPVLRSLMIIFNCNRTIKQDNSLMNGCLDILKKIVTNLQTEDLSQFEKFSRVRRSKIEQKVLSLTGALDFLYAIGFTSDKEDLDWLVYDVQDEDVPSKMKFILELLQTPQIFPIELDRQLKHILEEEKSTSQDSSDDLKFTSSDLKHLYNNLEKNREINEMFVSKETKARLISNTSNYKSLFAKLRFQFRIIDNEINTVEAIFYSSEKLFQVKDWFISNFNELFGEKEIIFKIGPEQFIGASLERSLEELKLTPAATLTVICK